MTRTKIRLASATLAGLLAVVPFTGCKSTASAPKDQKVTVTFMTWETDTMNSLLTKSFEGFNKDHPNITVKLVPAPTSDYGTKLSQMIAANQAPDIFEAGNDMEIQNGQQGLLYNWTSKAKKDSEFINGFYPEAVQNWKADGKLYGLPGLLNVYGIFYNKSLLSASGVQVPKDGWKFSEMMQDAQKLTKNISGTQKYGLYYTGQDPFALSIYAQSAGGQTFANGITKVTKVQFDSAYKQILQQWIDAIKNKYLMPPTYDTTNLTTMFEQGQVAMLYGGQWLADDIIRNGPKSLQWGFVSTPEINTKSTTYDCVGWASPKTIKHPNETWEVLKYLDSSSYEQVLPQTPVAPAAYQKADQPYFDKLKADGHAETAEAINYMSAQKNKVAIRFLPDWAGDATKFITADWNKILMGQEPLSKVDEIAKNINNVIEQNG